MHHKAALLLGESDDFRSVFEAIDTMDSLLLPRLRNAGHDRQRTDAAIAAIKNLLDLIRFKFNELFERMGSQDDRLDAESQLPARRYLPAILANAMRAHQTSGRPCCLLLIEVQLPQFKRPHLSGYRSRLLQVAVNTLVDCSRTSDHLFRFDEQRLLLIAVECPRQGRSVGQCDFGRTAQRDAIGQRARQQDTGERQGVHRHRGIRPTPGLPVLHSACRRRLGRSRHALRASEHRFCLTVRRI